MNTLQKAQSRYFVYKHKAFIFTISSTKRCVRVGYGRLNENNL